MSTSKHQSTTFDDIVNTCPLLFRLHSCGSSRTFFDAERKTLLASRHAQKRKDSNEVSYDLKGLEHKDPLLTLDNKDAVAEHVTAWANGKPSNFISVTSNIQYVLWEWKRRRSYQLCWRDIPQDDHIVILLESSKLRGRAKLGIEILGEDQEPAYRFAHFANEVIVADFIRSPTIVGTLPMSQLEVFIPSWWRKPLASMEQGQQSEEKGISSFKSFLSELIPPPNKDERFQEALRFALALTSPVVARELRADNGSVVNSATMHHPSDEGATPRVDCVAMQTVAREGESLVTYGRQNCSPESGSLPAGMEEDGPVKEPPSEGRLLEEQRGLVQVTTNPERGGDNPERLQTCDYVGALTAGVWSTDIGGRVELRQVGQETWMEDLQTLLGLYRKALEKDSGEPLEILHKVMDEYWTPTRIKEQAGLEA